MQARTHARTHMHISLMSNVMQVTPIKLEMNFLRICVRIYQNLRHEKFGAVNLVENDLENKLII